MLEKAILKYRPECFNKSVCILPSLQYSNIPVFQISWLAVWDFEL